MKKYLILLAFLSVPVMLNAQIKIWDGTICRAKQVTITEYLPEGTPKAAVIVCPGGGYHFLADKHEGSMVAEWLASEGYVAYVLRYRVSGKFKLVSKNIRLLRGNRHPDMIADLQRAIQIVRTRYNGPVGVMGFSAGGHLVMMSAEFYNTNFLERYNLKPASPLRPDFVASIYPVVTMSDDRYAHKGSRQNLLGERGAKNPVMRDSLSMEKHAHSDMPPVFLVNCKDDATVSVQNSVLLDSALSAQHVPHHYIQYETGGHGFGVDPKRLNEETSNWQAAFLEWMRNMSF